MRPILRLPLQRFARPTYRPFTAASRLRLKEDEPGTNKRAEEIEKAKHDQMNKGEWKEELASAGESQVKADKEHVKNHDSHMEDLQKQTANKSQEEHPHGKS